MEQCARISIPQFNKYYRYNHTEKGRARSRKYDAMRNREERTAYEGERYHKIQDEAGCHRELRDFYFGYQLLKALIECKEVIEI